MRPTSQYNYSRQSHLSFLLHFINYIWRSLVRTGTRNLSSSASAIPVLQSLWGNIHNSIPRYKKHPARYSRRKTKLSVLERIELKEAARREMIIQKTFTENVQKTLELRAEKAAKVRLKHNEKV